MGEEPQGRELSQTIAAVKAHVQWKIDSLPQLSRQFGLDTEAVADLEHHLTAELDYLGTLPQGITLGEVMKSHFESVEQVGQMVMGGRM